MGMELSMHGGEDKCINDFGGKAKRKEIARKTWM
jgi:hypothetical protein